MAKIVETHHINSDDPEYPSVEVSLVRDSNPDCQTPLRVEFIQKLHLGVVADVWIDAKNISELQQILKSIQHRVRHKREKK